MSHSACIACGGFGSREVLAAGGAPRQPVVVRRCERCHHCFLAGWERSYDLGLYDYYADRVGATRDELYDPLTTRRYEAVLDALRPAGVGHRLLDVGCGEGQLVATALAQGFDAIGIDVAPGAIEVCRSLGLPCRQQDLFSSELDGERFDVVTLVETIEHVPDPLAMLVRCRELLAPGGAVWLTTPNFASLGRRALGGAWPALSPEHLSYFVPASLRALAREAGFASVEARSRSISAAALRRLLRRPSPEGVPVGARVNAASPGHAAEQQLRHQIEARSSLRGAKAAMNLALSACGLGETLVATLRTDRPRGRRR